MRSRSDLEGGTLHSDVHHDTMACAEKKKTYPPKTDTYPTLGKEKHRLKSAFIGGDMLVTRRVYQIASVWWFCQKKGTYILNQNVTWKAGANYVQPWGKYCW